MSAATLDGLGGEEELRAAARSRAFALLGEALEYPDESLLEDIRSGRLAEALGHALSAVDSSLADGLDRDALSDGLEGNELAIAFTGLFDVGIAGPPCPLHGGLWSADRMKTMEEAVRFYSHFGLSLSESPRELPDHLSAELEFLHYLGFREAEALQTGTDPGPYRRAQRDFVERHPGRWIPRLREKLEQQDPPRFTLELFRALERLLDYTVADLHARTV